jgi:beta-glucosidase
LAAPDEIALEEIHLSLLLKRYNATVFVAVAALIAGSGLVSRAASVTQGGNGMIANGQAAPVYLKPGAVVEDRVRDLLSRMTVEEKARQLDMYSGRETKFSAGGKLEVDRAKELWGDIGVGSIHDLYPRDAALPNEIQAWLKQNTRLGIPALFIEEGLHGYLDPGHTVFPQSIALAATFNPDNARRAGAAIAAEMRSTNVHMSLSPVLCLARDPRWGRSEETYGEDPFLSGRIGMAYVQGMQGNSLMTDHTVIAEPKHFAAHGSPEGGRNTNTVHVGERELRDTFLPAFEAAFTEGGAFAAMCAYHEIDGVPCAANHHLLMDILRGEWGFKGFVLSDLGAINELETRHHVAANAEGAISQAITAGVDMQFYDYSHDVFLKSVVAAIADGSLAMADLDRAAGDVLRMKFMLGLFDKPNIDPGMAARVLRKQEFLDTSLQTAREAICLLKNEGGLLPLKKDVKAIALIGPGAAELRTGDYSGEGAGHTVSIREGLEALKPAGTTIIYAKGCDFDAPSGGDENASINEAVNAAKGAGVAIVCLGESSDTCGEGIDRETLDLTGRQEQLLEAVSATGTPVVLVLQNGRALTINWAAQHVPAIVDAWYSGEFGGKAIAEVLFGDYNPAGRLPVSFPKTVGQIPVTYDRKPSSFGGYVEGDSKPLFAFGYGLSYTRFAYSDLTVSPETIPVSGKVSVTVDVRNEGDRAGDEVVQLYVRDLVGSTTTPVKALRGFQRIHLKPGEKRTVTFQLGPHDLQLLNREMRWVVEPGEFEVMVGGSSVDGLKHRFAVK